MYDTRARQLQANRRRKDHKPRIFGYCRASTERQQRQGSITRQRNKIKKNYPNIREYDIYSDTGTGKDFAEENRPNWHRLLNVAITEGDTIVFTDVSRFSRNVERGMQVYNNLTRREIYLIFLKKDQRNANNAMLIDGTIPSTATKTPADYMCFHLERAQREIENISKGTKEGLKKAKAAGRKAGAPKGKRQTRKKELATKPLLIEYNRLTQTELNRLFPNPPKDIPKQKGVLTDKQFHDAYGISTATISKYRKELIQEIQAYIEQGTRPCWLVKPLRRRKPSRQNARLDGHAAQPRRSA